MHGVAGTRAHLTRTIDMGAAPRLTRTIDMGAAPWAGDYVDIDRSMKYTNGYRQEYEVYKCTCVV